MQHQKQDVLALAKRKQMRPQRHLARKIKSSLRRFRQRPRKLPFAHRANQKPKARRSPCQNLLPRYPKPLREDRAQAFVALDNIPKRSFQRPHIQLASKPNRQWDRVAPASSFQPLQKPQPALPIRQPHLTRTLNRTQRWTRCTRLPQPLNQPRYRRPLKQAADRYLNLKARTHAADQTRRKQRMAPKRKKVVVDPNSLQPQDLGKQSAQQLLTRTARKTQYRSPHLRRRQRSAVQLPVRRQRQMLQNHNRRRHHVLGKARSNMRTQRRRINLRPSRQNNIANKLRTTRPIRARNHNRLRHAVMPQQRCLDLPGLNAEAADLNLLVRSPHKLQNPIPAPARQVPAAVHPAPRSAKPIRNKALTRQPPAPNIPTTNPSTRDVKLPNYPNRHRLQTTVQYINPQIGDAAPDEVAAGREGKVSVKQNMTDMHRRLGDAVHVDQHRGTVEVMLIPIFKSPHIQCFATKDHMPQNKRSSELGMLPLRLHQLVECRRGLVEDGDAFARNQRQELSRRAADQIGNDDQSTAMEKWPPNLPD